MRRISKMNVKNWNFYYDKKEKGYQINHLWERIFLCIAIGFLWVSFFQIVEEHYPAFLRSNQIEINQEIESDEALSNQSEAGIWEVLTNPDMLEEGFLSIAEVYIADWNTYYHTNYVVLDATGNYMPETFFLITIVCWIVVMGNAYLMRKRIFYALFPMIPLVMQFLVGYSPKAEGMLYFFIGAILLLSIEKKEAIQIFARTRKQTYQIEVVFSKMLTLLLSVLSLFFAGILFEEPIVKWQEKKQDVLEWQQNSKLVTAIEKLFRGWDFQFSAENLNNRTPQYTGKLILEVEAHKKPETNLYLKAFYGTEYKNGTWNKDDNLFSKACSELGYKEQELSQFISRMPTGSIFLAHNRNMVI